MPSLGNQRIWILHQDADGNVWIGADEGLYRLKKGENHLTRFSVWDHVQNGRFNVNSFYAASDGSLYLGGQNGLNFFKTARMTGRPGRMNVSLSQVVINQTDTIWPQSPVNSCQFEWNENSFEFGFTTPWFGDPRKLEYRYRLWGLDTGWVYNGKNDKVRFSALRPGDYKFTVSASIDGRRWDPMLTPFRFSIATPFWKTGWFMLACALTVLFTAYWVGRQRAREIQKQSELQERVLELEMKALRAQMNPHFIFNCLNSINRYIVKSDHATASRYLTRFSKLIRLILDNSNNKQIALSNELDALRLYIEMEALRFDNRFTYAISTEAGLYPEAIKVPPMLLQPYVENAIWHGLMHKEDNGHLSVSLRQPAHQPLLECVIEDNGIGRKRSLARKSKSVTHQKSLGMKLTSDRIAALNQATGTVATVDIEDLTDKNGEATGTRVTIRIPVD